MDGIQILAAVITIIGTVGTIIGSMYGMLKFMLNDIHKDMQNFEKRQDKFDMELLHINKRLDGLYSHLEQEMRMTNNRLDGLYRVILDRTYGKNIPEELK